MPAGGAYADRFWRLPAGPGRVGASIRGDARSRRLRRGRRGADAGRRADLPQAGCIYADQALIRPDTTTNYEVGLRCSWRDERFTLSATLFHVDWTDIQVAGLTPFSAEPITLNGGGAVSRGVELASSVSLTNASRLRGSWSSTRAALSRDAPGLLDDGAEARPGPGAVGQGGMREKSWRGERRRNSSHPQEVIEAELCACREEPDRGGLCAVGTVRAAPSLMDDWAAYVGGGAGR